MPEGIGDRYQRETKYNRERMPHRRLDWRSKPDVYKVYPGSTRVELPRPRPETDMAVDEALSRRRSIRDFAPDPVSLEQLSYLLWAATGLQREEYGYEFRTAPSAGALYPIETYLVAKGVIGLEEGVYHYSVRDHKLEELRKGDFSIDVARAALDQVVAAKAAVVFIWTAVFYRSKWKYDQRAYRYVYLDAGHIGENLYLAAVTLGLGVCTVGAIYDDEANQVVDVDGVEESVIYMAAVGKPSVE